ncbi:hypothetical protein FRACA_890005 [Frankia canadensis]|uniref:Uncharacterized protein n=1 Tax=Frankia canadensis TaxID=1836972 RepID=A0A2I2L284_9ACTN|nr:hypothetical protein FRACA_890005 [Frankia canadensis]SOU59267.1 hypothetical protein FRACA_890005 [Frankia canadensis]
MVVAVAMRRTEETPPVADSGTRKRACELGSQRGPYGDDTRPGTGPSGQLRALGGPRTPAKIDPTPGLDGPGDRAATDGRTDAAWGRGPGRRTPRRRGPRPSTPPRSSPTATTSVF